MHGTVHIAFGDNTDMPGGKNNSANHMDFMMDKPTVKAIMEDGSEVSLLVDGKYQDDESIEEAPLKTDKEKLPVSEVYMVVDYITLFKTDLWWEAVVVFETYGKRQMGLYLWQKRNGVWKRKNKFGIRNLDEWSKLRGAIDQLAPRLVEANK